MAEGAVVVTAHQSTSAPAWWHCSGGGGSTPVDMAQ